MKKQILATMMGLFVCTLLSPAVRAQAEQAQKKPPGPAEVILLQWNYVGNKLAEMAEDFPEAKYDYRPNDQVRTFAQQVLHASASMYYATNAALGKPTDKIDENPSRDIYKTKAEVVAFVKKCVEDGAAAIQKDGDSGVVKHIGAWDSVIEHSGEHYGQLVVYYRLNGLVPPETRREQQQQQKK